MKKYDTYKDSGNQWIGQVPEHWILSKIKYNFGIISGCGFKEKYQGEIEGDYPFCKASDINGMGKTISTARNYVTTKIVLKERYNIIPANSILFAKIGEALKKNHRKINTIECIVDNNCQALVPAKNQNTSYMYYLLTQIDMAWFDNAGTIPCVNNQKLKDFRIALPPLSEQQAIVEFLDKKTGQIDQSIALLETQKTDLQSYRNRLIDEMLWNKNGEVKKICFKYITDIITVKSISHIKVGLENIESGTGKYIATESNFAGNGIAFIKGDILYGKLRPYLKKVWHADFGGAAIGDFYVYRAKSDVLHSKYLQYFLLSDSFTSLANSSTYGAKMPRVSSDFIGNILISLPPLSEQQAIVSYLDKKTNEIDAALKQMDTQITDLQAYRTALISEAVTGKIDVR